MHLLKKQTAAVASLIGGGFNFDGGPGLADTFITSPVFNFPIQYAGPAQDLAVGNPGATFGIWNASDLQGISFVQRTEQFEFRCRKPVHETDWWRCYGLAGGRFFWIWESFQWRTVDADINGNASEFDAAVYTNVVSNRMYGPFVGVGNEWFICSNSCGAFSVSLDLEAA